MNGAPEVRRQMLQWQNDDTDGGALTDTLTAPQKHWNWWDTINLSNIHVLGTVDMPTSHLRQALFLEARSLWTTAISLAARCSQPAVSYTAGQGGQQQEITGGMRGAYQLVRVVRFI